jgi:hypothetical protein
MGDLRRIARIGQHRIECFDQSEAAIRFAQEQEAPIAGDIAARERGLDFPAIKAWKVELGCGTVWH